MNRKEIKAKAKEFAFSNKWNVWQMSLLIGAISAILSTIFNAFGQTQVCTIATESATSLLDTTNCTTTTYGMIVELITTVIGFFTGAAATAYCIELVRTKKMPSILKSFEYALKNWKIILLTSIIYSIAVTIGMVLLIVPGIILALGLSFFQMVTYDNPNLAVDEILKKTWNLTKGYKASILGFGLSFIGWIILCVFIIPVIWVVPYMTIANVMYYEELLKIKKEN